MAKALGVAGPVSPYTVYATTSANPELTALRPPAAGHAGAVGSGVPPDPGARGDRAREGRGGPGDRRSLRHPRRPCVRDGPDPRLRGAGAGAADPGLHRQPGAGRARDDRRLAPTSLFAGPHGRGRLRRGGGRRASAAGRGLVRPSDGDADRGAAAGRLRRRRGAAGAQDRTGQSGVPAADHRRARRAAARPAPVHRNPGRGDGFAPVPERARRSRPGLRHRRLSRDLRRSGAAGRLRRGGGRTLGRAGRAVRRRNPGPGRAGADTAGTGARQGGAERQPVDGRRKPGQPRGPQRRPDPGVRGAGLIQSVDVGPHHGHRSLGCGGRRALDLDPRRGSDPLHRRHPAAGTGAAGAAMLGRGLHRPDHAPGPRPGRSAAEAAGRGDRDRRAPADARVRDLSMARRLAGGRPARGGHRRPGDQVRRGGSGCADRPAGPADVSRRRPHHQGDGPAARRPEAGGHRRRHHARHRARRRGAEGPARGRGQPGAGRLRHRLLVAGLSDAPAVRHAEDRPLLRADDGQGRGLGQDRQIGRQPGPRPGAGSRGRGGRERRPRPAPAGRRLPLWPGVRLCARPAGAGGRDRPGDEGSSDHDGSGGARRSGRWRRPSVHTRSGDGRRRRGRSGACFGRPQPVAARDCGADATSAPQVSERRLGPAPLAGQAGGVDAEAGQGAAPFGVVVGVEDQGVVGFC
uniref:LigA n=1 Tax=Parastrongyloides trichosuri TaxID=131310 RepID=A0A0N5A105_PARTI